MTTAPIIRRCAAGFLFALLALTTTSLLAQQMPPGAPGGGGRPNMNIGRFYGKVVDEKGKGVGYASVQLLGMRFDTTTKTMKEALITGQITEDNGDFSLENLPVMGEFTLRISFLGYDDVEQKVSFGLTGGPGGPGGRNPGQGGPPANMSAMASKLDQDLGNISLAAAAQVLDEVVVTGEAGTAQLALDRKIYRVDKNGVAAGGTAEDALRTLPSLAVDLDGNVTLRNAAPQIFVDGRPTTLTLDQISADAIESVEVVTNPSAKYDASGGQAGIVNIVLKKDRRIGYNGNLRVGADTRAGANLGGDINAREGKVNAFIGANFNRRRGFSDAQTDRQNLFGNPLTNVLQTTDSKNNGFFANIRTGVDWFLDNRNTLTFAGNLTRGQFGSDDVIDIRTDTLLAGGIGTSNAVRTSDFTRNFRNVGGSILFKHLFPMTGKEWTADINYNRMSNDGGGTYLTNYLPSVIQSQERQDNEGGSGFVTFQTDLVHPFSDKIKLETGARVAIRNFSSDQFRSIYDYDLTEWIPIVGFSDRYKFEDQVYAAYGSFSHSFPKWGYQLGLRVESSRYTGELTQINQQFTNNFPLSLFPSIFITRKLNEEDNIQFSYTRRINRPNFFQLIPFTDFSDSLNLQRGNPDLLPEFTNSLELTYQNIFSKGHNLLVSAYYKQATDLITRYQFGEFNEEVNKDVIVSSYANSNSSEAYGVEFTLRNTVGKIFEFTSNLNLYNSRVDASNVEAGLVNERFTWFFKENLQVRLPAQFTLQINGEYQSRAAFTPSSGNGRFGGHWGGPTNTAQGYTLANWFVDMALRKDLFNRKATLTVNMNDIFRTRRTGTYSSSDFFVQNTWRVRDPQVVRVNLSYRFGKMDASLFKRKNTRMGTEGMEMMQ